MTTYTEFDEIPVRRYSFIMADPPWTFKVRSAKGEAKSAQAKYRCASIEDIAALPVGDLAARDCVLWLWATNPMLDQQIDVLKGWGFRLSTSGAWTKTTVNGKIHFGTGYVLRGSGEPYLIGTIGKPRLARSVRSHFLAQTREHSRKPDEAYANAEAMMPGAEDRLDLFSRQTRPGWDNFGDEADFYG